MSRSGILAAAVALRRFTVAQIAAYCEEDEETISSVLHGHPELLECTPGSGQWQVLSANALRSELAGSGTGRDPGGSARPCGLGEAPQPVAKLLLAEETLLECGRERLAANRQTMAATALNRLRQFVAAFLPEARSWWDIDIAREVAGTQFSTAPGGVNPARLRLDLTLARLTRAEAAGETVAGSELIRAALDLGALPAAMDGQRRWALVDRFTVLSREVLRLPGGPASTSPSARYLTALAFLRARVQAERSLGSASGVLVQLFRGLAGEPALRLDGPANRLYRVLGAQADGQIRLAVYADLLHLLPRGSRWHRRAELLPGVMVEALADDRASTYLRECATEMERQLTRSPFNSESALIGQAVHVFEDLAVSRAGLDETVMPRSERTRRELLSLAGVLV